MNLASLTGVQPLAGPEDAPCCPSGAIRFTLALQGSALVLADATVDVPEPEATDSAGAAEPDGAGAREPR